MNKDISELSTRLNKFYNSNLVCGPGTDITIEGFPRCSNTYCIDYIRYLCEKKNRQLSIAHHTHSPWNVEMAIQLGIPCLILIREPINALTSFAIYGDHDVSKVAGRYLDFYKDIDSWAEHVLIADFELVINDFNKVIKALNERFDIGLPLSEDMLADKVEVMQIDVKRARDQRSGEEFIRTVGAPNERRDQLKAELRPEVVTYINTHSDIMRRYEHIKFLPNYIGS